MHKNKLSVIIIAYNEEKNIERCIVSAQSISDDIIVVDSYSTDKTTEIASGLGAKVVQQNFLGYAEQKNFAAKHAKYDFVLSLDADEELSAELSNSISNITLENNTIYSFNRLTFYCGRWIKHCGWYPDVKQRIYNHTQVKWGGESVHEILIADTKANYFHLKGDLKHYSYYTIDDHLKQLDKFTTLQANELHKKNINPNVYHFIIKPLAKFIRDYFIKLGVLDFWQGLSISILSAFGVYLKYKKLRSIIKSKN